MTRFFVSIIAIVSILTLFSSCKKMVGSGPTVSETRNHSGFSGVDLSINATVNITQDNTYSVEVIAQQNILDILRTHVDGSTLCIGYEKPNLFVKATKDIIINIHMPAVNSLDVSGSGEVNGINAFTASSCSMNVSGSGDISLNSLEAQSIDSKISGSGNVTIHAGSSNTLDSKISGSGDMDLINVVAKDVETTTSGSGKTKVHATQNLDVQISGSGNVYYRGTPSVNTSISGSGKLIHQN